MGLNLDTAAVTPVLKNRYTEKKIETLAFQSALLAKMPKDGSYGGVAYIGAIRTGTTTSRSASDATAFTTGSASSYSQWTCAWKYDYASGNITGTAIDQAKGDANALVDAMVGEFDGVFISLGISAGASLFGNGGGAIGQILSGQGTPTIQLTVPSTIVNFLVGQILQVSVDDGTGGAGVRAGTVLVTGVDINAGTVTCSGNWTAGIAAAAANDFIFQQSDYAAKLIGLPGWIPTLAARTGTPWTGPFNGVVRTADGVRLGGVAYNGAGAPKAESLMQLAMLVNRMSGKPTVFVCNPLDYVDIEKDMGSRVQYTTESAFNNPQIGFPAFKIATAYGIVTVLTDVFCPAGQGYLLNIEEWLMPSMGKLPKVIGQGTDGLDWLRAAGSDAYQMRACYRASTYCAAPGHQGVVVF